MNGAHHGNPCRVSKPFEHASQIQCCSRVQPAGGLVEKQKARHAQQRFPNRQPSLLSARKTFEEKASCADVRLLRQPKRSEHSIYAALTACSCVLPKTTEKVMRETESLSRGGELVEMILLLNILCVVLNQLRRAFLLVEINVAVDLESHSIRERVQQRRLSAARRTHNINQLARVEHAADPVQDALRFARWSLHQPKQRGFGQLHGHTQVAKRKLRTEHHLRRQQLRRLSTRHVRCMLLGQLFSFHG
mmetsp:Transcript_11123/g.23884  ORF Transcript_11123/g.23884 Transcript_11123/m.23884 type:complete len:248 (-) Transcript_11123:130-873(-)